MASPPLAYTVRDCNEKSDDGTREHVECEEKHVALESALAGEHDDDVDDVEPGEKSTHVFGSRSGSGVGARTSD